MIQSDARLKNKLMELEAENAELRKGIGELKEAGNWLAVCAGEMRRSCQDPYYVNLAERWLKRWAEVKGGVK